MKPTEFVYWLQGFFELSESTKLSEKQVEMIKNHLAMVFYHEIDPSYTKDVENGKKHQEKLNELHQPKMKFDPATKEQRRKDFEEYLNSLEDDEDDYLPPPPIIPQHLLYPPDVKSKEITSQQVTDADSKAWPEETWPLKKKQNLHPHDLTKYRC